jgi:hypothetical protein
LTWATTNATTVTLDGAAVAATGSRVVSPTATRSYALVATGAGGNATANATITVTATPPPPTLPTATLSAAPGTIQSGQSSTLTWATTNATTVTLDGAAVAATGSRVVSPTATRSYALVATGAGGNANANTTIIVTAPPPVGLTYVKDIAPIMSAQCNACHSGSSPSAGVDTATYTALMRTVTAGSANSTLIRATQPGGSMVRYMGANAAQYAETIRRWIVEFGAAQQ